MFAELMPLVADRTLLITVARESDTTLRVNVVPKRTAPGDNAALSTPLSLAGIPEELDRAFAQSLAEYAETHQRLSSTLAQAKAEMEAAAKAAQEEAKRKADEKRKAKPSTSTPATSTQSTGSASPESAQATTSSLFGGTSAEPTQSQQQQQQQQQGGLRL